MSWRSYCITPYTNRKEAVDALTHAIKERVGFVILCSSEGLYLGVLTLNTIITWVHSGEACSLEALANPNYLALHLGANHHRTRRVMRTKKINAVPAIKDGEVVGVFKI
jgi:predicted transcriptional regulator